MFDESMALCKVQRKIFSGVYFRGARNASMIWLFEELPNIFAVRSCLSYSDPKDSAGILLFPRACRAAQTRAAMIKGEASAA